MDWLTFISEIAKALAWPLVVVILGLSFRDKISDLILMLRTLKAGPVEAVFDSAAKQVALAAAREAAGTPSDGQRPDAHAPDEPPAASERSEQGILTALNKLERDDADPAAAILDAWSSLDGELFRFGQQMGMAFSPVEKRTRVFQEVVDSSLLPAGTTSLLVTLRTLYNQVRHGEASPSPSAAQDLLLAIQRATELVHNFRKNLPNYDHHR